MPLDDAANSVTSALVEAWNRHDAAAFAAAFSPAAEFTNVFGMKANGREEIEKFHTPLFATMFRYSRLLATEVSSRELRPDVATIDLHWSMSGARDPDDKEWPDRIGLISLVIVKQQGRWSIETMHNMELEAGSIAEAQRELQRDVVA